MDVGVVSPVFIGRREEAASVAALMARAIRTALATGVGPPLDALLHATGDSQPDEAALDRVVRDVLRSALQQRQARQAGKGGLRLALGANFRFWPPAVERS